MRLPDRENPSEKIRIAIDTAVSEVQNILFAEVKAVRARGEFPMMQFCPRDAYFGFDFEAWKFPGLEIFKFPRETNLVPITGMILRPNSLAVYEYDDHYAGTSRLWLPCVQKQRLATDIEYLQFGPTVMDKLLKLRR